MKKKKLKNTAILILTAALLGGCGSKSAGSYHKDGLEYFNSGNYDKAEVSLAKALEMNADRADYYIDYAMTLIQLGKYEEAIQYFNRIILDKDNSIVKKNNKIAYRGKGIAYFNSHSYTKAIEQFDKALAIDELSDLNMDILCYKGNSQEKAGLYEKAAETYTAVLDKKPSDADTYNNRANVYSRMGNYEKSLADYDQAIKLDNKNYDSYFGKYFLMSENGDEKGASAVLEMASHISGTTQEDKFNLAKVHYYMENYDSAIAELDEAFRNGYTEAYFYLGNIYEKKKDYETAVYNYGMYISKEADIESAAVYNQLGVCLIKEGNYEEALSYIQKGLEYNEFSFNQALKRNEIIAYENLGDFEEAYARMTEYLALYPEDKEALEENEFLKTRLPEVSTVKEE